MKTSYEIARAAGIPIRVHITLGLLMIYVLARMPFTLWGLGLAAVATVMGCIALHELGHAMMARRFGCRTRSILLLPIGGVAQLDRMPAKPVEEVLVALAGPAVSLALAALFWAAHILFPPASESVMSLRHFLVPLAVLNLVLGLFNLIPSFPMDGGRVFRAWMTPRLGRLEATRRAAKIGQTLAVLFGVYSLFSGHFLHVLLAGFVYFVAGSEYRQVWMQEMMKRQRGEGFPFNLADLFGGARSGWGGRSGGAAADPSAPFGRPSPLRDSEIVVSPPPYAQEDARQENPRS